MVFKAIWKPLAITSLVANQQWQARWNERDAAGGLRTSIAQLRRQLADSETGRLSATAQVSAAIASASVCLPTCSANLSDAMKSWQRTLTEQGQVTLATVVDHIQSHRLKEALRSSDKAE